MLAGARADCYLTGMVDLVTRTAGLSDAAAIAALTDAAYAKWVPILGRKPLPMTVDYAEAVLAHRIDVVDGEDGLAALIEMSLEADHLLIVNLAVAPARQGQGLGAALLAHAAAVARHSGRDTVRLFTNGRMETNIALYRRHGFVIDSEEVRSPQWRVVHMVRRLP